MSTRPAHRSGPVAAALTTRGRQRAGPVAAATLLLVAVACASGPPREPIKMPPVASLRAAAGVLVDRVEIDDEAPDWLDRDRVEEGVLYGIGIQPGGRDPVEDLYLAMHGARRSIIVWLEARGAGSSGPNALLPPMRVDPDRVAFERLAYEKGANRWYALARLDIAGEAAAIEKEVVGLEQKLAAAQLALVDAGVEADDRIQAALTILYGLDRRRQYGTLHLALTGKELVPPTGLDDATLLERADDALARHAVRIIVQGWSVPGLYEAIASALGEVSIRTDEFGPGLVSVLVLESDGFGPGNPYLEVEGTVEVAVAGGDARTRTTPFRVVSTGISLDEARFRAARGINQEVRRIVRETLRDMAGVGS
jgi:hypothetical protein